ncbi:MAG: sulfatase-like hydrolase/transferase [Myxococcota bacterium]|nr:sulfatase-like hydrolase/transferase [bacterium]MDP6243577.1 sulfatase-like hydrolase/transferase [Myxococcota bacterium]MDP7075275.1 sulfatase-like hydrolase/transferase [Myxococcota bacterium]MDP7299171.1 sulfatase-like hydrolase/transferase [Myxococcota bacterium]MDP7434329.1 sulfatase-like hydrolase/transferase [Myxococcota bacterium]
MKTDEGQHLSFLVTRREMRDRDVQPFFEDYPEITVLLAALLAMGCGSEPEAEPATGPCWGPGCVETVSESPENPSLVVFAVMDTVRAASLSMCGYGRPTSPFLQSMVDAGAAWSCRAQTPSSWTVPSHASFFTGKNVFEHNSHRRGESILPLASEWETLAERFSGRGYDTVCISANSFVSEGSGLTQGCDFIRKGLRKLRGDEVVSQLGEVLEGRTHTDRPLFVFLNFYEAHTPWQPVPAGVEWLESRELLENDTAKRWDFVLGKMGDREAQEYIEHIGDLYDYGVFLEDRYLGEAFELLNERGLMAGGVRFVVTSDHGELLGEHGLLNHGKTLHEPITRVPLVYWEKPTRGEVHFPESPFSAISSYYLVLEGRYVPVPAMAVDLPFPYWAKHTGGKVGNETWFARWEGSRKTIWKDGQAQRIDLDADPDESDARLVDTPLPVEFQGIVSVEKPESEPTPPEMLEMLKALGYAE